jgi:hypothetical protein
MKIPEISGIFIVLVLTSVALKPVHAAVFNCSAGDVDCLIDAINTANTNDKDDNSQTATSTGTDYNYHKAKKH